jgi:hypothetical protein
MSNRKKRPKIKRKNAPNPLIAFEERNGNGKFTKTRYITYSFSCLGEFSRKIRLVYDHESVKLSTEKHVASALLVNFSQTNHIDMENASFWTVNCQIRTKYFLADFCVLPSDCTTVTLGDMVCLPISR